ncbi:RpiB/LacA/LacB family sugar-phosphate isomerase [Candidatus Microgenomates bacterium]|nr:RpiB/LacA/LacB family sugar-phosphate isomerase [Candidatus Microgenomates bacterium]
MKIYIGADHGGYLLKEKLKSYLAQLGHDVEDRGAPTLDPSDDYTDFIFPVAEHVAQDLESRGIVLGRSGQGEVIAANKTKGIRAALCMNEKGALKAREDNDANILSLGADVTNEGDAKKIVKIFLETPFSNKERHVRRLKKIADYETAHSK